MKETTKVSIGGYAFTLDVDAYEELQAYLENLKRHFSTKDEGAEIIQDIEARMSELLQLKNAKTDGVITLEDAKDIIKIMGNPKDFEDESASDNPTSDTAEDDKRPASIGKRFYRDTDNAILGGVCSGIGHYFNLDPVMVRVIYLILLSVSNPLSHKISAFFFLLYFILWIVMPAARTFAQKLAMSGKTPTIENIQSGNLPVKKKGAAAGRVLIKTLKILVGLICYLTGISIILAGAAMFFFAPATGLPTFNELTTILGFSNANLGITLILVWFIPALIIIYIGIRIMIEFTSRDLIIIGIGFGIWVVACGYGASVTTHIAQQYKHQSSESQIIQPQTQADTLYINIGNLYKQADLVGASKYTYKLEGNPDSWFFVPSIRVVEDTTAQNFSIEINKKAFASSKRKAKAKADKAKFDVQMQDSLVTINPRLYNKKKQWDREYFNIVITRPKSKEVKIDSRFPDSRDFAKTSWHYGWSPNDFDFDFDF
ncbi:PspC domain-containing protein [Dysgonomonas macrotermitis]|uniref:Phage shock protein C (PspC) family protein n=1 Tax=Dysgonomonas macrotermitis TaxID=1346286 RepID=A0A1M5EJI8_9BACT|nr:PspC domain-containing protein [Dysgonomonas macrotermitis]SHF79428.1 phage shock protein C (PspC) family protein [Dysgonomonas macrotermitis]